MTTFGDLAWGNATRGGQLGALDRLAQTFAAVRFRLRRKLAASPSFGARSAGEIERMLSELELPHTEVVARAAALVEKLGPPALACHALRTFAWGGLLGLRDGLVWDRETFALGALLHDLGLAQRREDVPCFAVDGARQAADLLSTWGASDARRTTVADTISMHLRVAVPTTAGVEAHLVHAGAAVDVVGARLAQIVPKLRAIVLARHPRDGFEDYLIEALRREAATHPKTRIGLWVSLGFLDRIAATRRMFGGAA